MWLLPALLVLLTISQVKAALDLQRTLAEGTPAVAEVVDRYQTDRVDVTYAQIQLRITMPEGEVVERTLPLPISLLPLVEGKDTVDVRVMEGAAQEVVIADIARPQWRMAAINAGVSLLGLVMLTIGVFAWNRYLARKGDPADRTEVRK